MFSISYTKKLSDAKQNGRYICFRERYGKEENLGVFNDKTDNANIHKFNKDLEDKKTQHPSVAVAHKMLFSMSGDEWNRSGFEPGDFQTLVRNVMKDYEQQTGKRLTWIAAEHRTPGHPHVHVLVKSVYHDKDGVPYRLKFDKDDSNFLKNSFQREKNYLRGFEVERPDKTHEYKPTRNHGKRATNDITKSLLNHVLNEMRQAEREMERERQNERDR